MNLLHCTFSLISWLAWLDRLSDNWCAYFPTLATFSLNRCSIWILTVGPSHNVLQKSILRGHESPPNPRHPASSLSFLQVNTPQYAAALHGLPSSETLRGFLERGWLAGCLSGLLISCLLSPVRCVGASSRTSHHPGEENNARAHRTGGAVALSFHGYKQQDPELHLLDKTMCVHWQTSVAPALIKQHLFKNYPLYLYPIWQSLEM